MLRLIRQGSKTKFETKKSLTPSDWALVCTALNDGQEIGVFGSVAEAEDHARNLLRDHPVSTYLVIGAGDVVEAWVYDEVAQRRREARQRLRTTCITFPILLLITAGAAVVAGAPVGTRLWWWTVGVCGVVYLAVRVSHNALESLVAWTILLVVTLINIPSCKKFQERRMRAQEVPRQVTNESGHQGDSIPR